MSTECNSAYEFLVKLATDDSFRDEVEKDPVSVFKENGLALDPAELDGNATLPSKEDIKKNLAMYAGRANKVKAMLFFFATR